jgi:hypothetical protein
MLFDESTMDGRVVVLDRKITIRQMMKIAVYALRWRLRNLRNLRDHPR